MSDESSVAIVGLSARYPGAPDIDTFWRNLVNGVDSISRFAPAELAAAGVPRRLAADPRYVPARGTVAGGEAFDWSYFGYSPAEAGRIDPQQRLFLQTAAAALDDAGLDPARFPGWVGVFAGADVSAQSWATDPANPDLVARVIGAEKDFLSTRVAYKLGLRGPALTVQTACSTSLVAVHVAVGSLLSHECDAALAGGVSLWTPQTIGYLYTEGHILSRDGRCRAFDADASGTVPSNGCGVVVLRRLADAERDGDRILAVLRGSAVNNDGGTKIGYTAPSIPGQRDVIRLALAQAAVDPADVSLVEAHGTGTAVGDPVEVAALTAAYRESDRELTGWCRIGSVKSNIGHAGAASGVAGLIKVVLQLAHREFVPTLHVERPNPELELETGPFLISDAHRPWPQGRARLAAVSSFGIGGTNAHAVLEAASTPAASPRGRSLFLVSAATPEANRRLRTALAGTGAAGADAAWTLAVGRQRHRYRWAAAGEDLAAVHDERAPVDAAGPTRLGFLFPGQGTLEAGAAAEPYRLLPAFRAAFDEAAALTAGHCGVDLHLLRSAATDADWLADTVHQQLGLFAVGWALAAQFEAWGARPVAMVGNSVGEYVAATVAGLWTLADGLAVVDARARAMRDTPEGRMFAAAIEPAAVAPLLARHPELALAVSAPGRVVLSGPAAAVDDLAVPGSLLSVRRAFHSPLMAPAAAAVRRVVEDRPRGPLRFPVISTRTGTALTDASADYWAQHLLDTVRLDEALHTLLSTYDCDVVVELGGGNSMVRAARHHPRWRPEMLAVSMLPDVLAAAGRLWECGLPVPVEELIPAGRKVALAPYPFEPSPCPAPEPVAAAPPAPAAGDVPTVRTWRAVAAGRPRAALAVFGDGMDDLVAVLAADPVRVTDAGQAQAVVAERPDLAALEALVARVPGDLLVLTSGVVDPLAPDQPDVLGWVEHHAGRVVLIDGQGCTAPPAPAPDCDVLVCRGGQWWGRSTAPVVVPPPVRRPVTLVTAGLADGGEVAVELSGAGLPIAASADDAPPTPAPQPRLPDEPVAGLSRHPQLQRRLDDYCAGLAATHAADLDGARYPRLARALRAMADAPGTTDPAGLEPVAGLRHLLDHVASAYPDVFAGRREPLDVLYPDGDPARLNAALNGNSVPLTDAEPCLRALIGAIRAAAVPGRPLRVLEVGAGQGLLTWQLIGDPPAAGLRYHFTDVSSLLVRRAREQAQRRGVTGMRFDVLDITRDPVEQGFAAGAYDVVVAYNVVHVASSVLVAVRHLATLLRPGGWLGLVELTRVPRWADMVWGLAPGWWDFADDVRDESVHLDAPAWARVLTEAGLQAAVHDAGDHALLTGRRSPARPAAGDDPLVYVGDPRRLTLPAGRPGTVVTLDQPGWQAQVARRRLDRSWRHVEVSTLDRPAALLPLIDNPAAPPVVRLDVAAPPAGAGVDPAGVAAATPAGTGPAGSAAAGSAAAGSAAAGSAAAGSAGAGRPSRAADPREEALRAAWCTALGVPSARDGDEFFALGGESLLAIELLARLRDQVGLVVTTADFLADATFGNLRRRLPVAVPQGREGSAGVPPGPAGVLTFQEDGPGTPVFFVPPGAGTSLVYRPLAGLLGGDRPSYGLESPTDPPLRDLTAIAAHHVRQVRAIRPGPYVLAGWSIGAMTAHEMAVQLHEVGERVEQIIGIDGFVPDTGGRPLGRLPGYQARALWYRVIAATGLDRDLPAGAGPVYRGNIQALLGYRPRPAPTRLALFKAGLTAARERRLRRVLAPMYAKGVTVQHTPGTHWTVLARDHVDILAAQVTRVLQQGVMES